MRQKRPTNRILKLIPLCSLLIIAMADPARSACKLNSSSGAIKHIVQVELDNIHFTRDNPNVPSDVEQMPNLLNFITHNGTLDAGDHTVLISHTANDILTTQTGLYSDNHGIFIANSFPVFGPGNSRSGIFFPSSFFYWTDLVSDIKPSSKDNSFALTTPEGANVPAPWVPFTRAGCDVGAFSTANIVLERTPFDVQKVFGKGSPQTMDPNQFGDFIGEAIHCAQGSALCTGANGGVADILPSEPGGYAGYMALYGAKYVSPILGGQSDLDGNSLTTFPGFDPTAAQTLGVVSEMLEHNIPIVFAYIADAHDNHEGDGLSTERTFGPGEAPYVQQLADYNKAFGQFFARLKKDGIDQTNTLFIFDPDEGDRFVGATPSPANCDGAKIVNGTVTPDVPCTYAAPADQPAGVGELDFNLNGAVKNAGNDTSFAIHFDDAATVFVPGQPARSDLVVRQLEKTMASLTTTSPYTGLSLDLLGTGLGPDVEGAIVDAAGQKLLHMNTPADAARSPTFTFFGDPDFFFLSFGPLTPVIEPNSFVDDTGFAWNHGDIQPEIGRTFVAIAGPGVKKLGVTQASDFFTDHVDLRPTIMLLSGLTDDYQHDGRAILELLDPRVLPHSLHAHSQTLLRLGQIYKQIDAPFGQLARSVLTVSTFAIESTSTNDQTYTNLESQIESWTSTRDTLAAQIKSMLEGAQFNGQSIDEQQAKSLISQGQNLLDQAASVAASL